jgi:biopolymer transport protein ExbD
LIKSATLNWQQIPIVLVVIPLFVFIWVVLEANELGMGFVDYGTAVTVPRNMNHATIGKLAFKRSMTVSMPKEGEVFWEGRRTAKEALPDRIRQSAAGKPEPNGIVYVEAEFGVRYQEILDLLRIVRQAGFGGSRLIVRQGSVTMDRPGPAGWLEVRLEPEPKPAPDISELKPDPLRLVAGIRAGGKLSLNATNMGSIEDPSMLASRLAEIFNACAEAGVAERSITVSAGDEVEYGEVAKLVDCLTGAGAGPIVMQLDAHIPIGRKPRRGRAAP